MRDALALAAGELVGPAVGGGVGVDADGLEHLVARLAARSALVPMLPDVAAARPRCRATLRRGFSDEIGSWKIICIVGAQLAQVLALERR